MDSCLSESSSTSNTEINPPNQREREDPENHKEGDEEKEKPMSTGYYLQQAPWICSPHLTKFPKHMIELDLISSLSSVPSGHGKQELVAETPADPPRVYRCNYCDRKFHSSQALGGHQNAHKSIRALANRHDRNRPQVAHHQYSSLANYASFGRSSNIGIVPQSMFRKPPLPPMLYRLNDGVDRKTAVAGGIWSGGGSGMSSDGKEEVKKLDLTLKI